MLCVGIAGQDGIQTGSVQRDDTCPKIARSQNISLKVLHANNPNINSDCSNLLVGEVS